MAMRRPKVEQREAPKPRKGGRRKPAVPAPVPGPEPGANGTASVEPVPETTARPAPVETPAPDPPEYRPGNSLAGRGKLLRDFRADAPDWFVEPWVSKRNLTLVIGKPGAGKSTFGAWLLAQAARPCILPGAEEDISTSLIPRLLVNGVDPDSCLILHDRAWRLPQDRHTLTDLLKERHTDLLWVDPLDTFVSVESENDADGVREALEAFCRLAHDVGCAIVGCRHPGKNPRNICPGSRNWRSIPREVIECSFEEGPPARRFMRLHRDPYNRGVAPSMYSLDGPEKSPLLFTWGETVDLRTVKTWDIESQVDFWKLDEACEFLKRVLKDSQKEARWLYQEASKEGLPSDLIRFASRRLGISVEPTGEGIEFRGVYPQYPTPPAPDTVTPPP